MKPEEVLRQYLEGAITFAEFVAWFANDYAEKQAKTPDRCLSCGGNLAARTGD